MRIGIDIRELERGTMTGTGRYLYALLGYVAKHDRMNDYILFGNQKTQLRLEGERLKVKIIPEFITPLWDQLILPWQIRKERINLFYSPYYKVPIFSSAKSIITIYDVYPIVDQANQGMKARVIRFWYWLMARNVARIITSSSYSKEKIEKLLKIAPSKIRIVYGDVEHRFKPFPRDEALKILGERYPSIKDFMLYVGSLWPNKNLVRLIEAYHQLPKELKGKYQLLICGRKNRFYGGLLRLVKKSGLAERVVFIDFVGDEALPYLYSGASAFVFPTLHEGFGLPVIEAMACGTPVVTSNVTSLPEVAAGAAILVDPYKVDEIKQAMIKVLTDSALREDLIKQGLERSRRFTPEQTAEQILKVFTEVGEVS